MDLVRGNALYWFTGYWFGGARGKAYLLVLACVCARAANPRTFRHLPCTARASAWFLFNSAALNCVALQLRLTYSCVCCSSAYYKVGLRSVTKVIDVQLLVLLRQAAELGLRAKSHPITYCIRQAVANSIFRIWFAFPHVRSTPCGPSATLLVERPADSKSKKGPTPAFYYRCS